MKLYWLLPGFVSILLASSPAEAAKLLSWRFDVNQNRLEFRTDDGIQPTAQLLANPTRLVIDLPGTTFGRPTVTQRYSGAIRSLRIGQFENRVTRLVIELTPGYTIDPEQVLVRGASPRDWTVQFPLPERTGQLPGEPTLGNPPPSTGRSFPSEPPLGNVSPPEASSRPPIRRSPPANGMAQIEDIQVTRDGFFLRTNGGQPKIIKSSRSRDRRNITIDVQGASLSPDLPSSESRVNRYGVSRIQLSQVDNSPSVVRITMNVTKESPEWRASYSGLGIGGLVLLPQGTTAANIESPPLAGGNGSPSRTVPTRPSVNQLATIQSVELTANGTQLLIRADQPVKPTSSWDRAAGVYRITIPSAQLADKVRGPQLSANTPVRRVNLQQQDSRTVVVLVQPSAGVDIGELNQLSDQVLALQLKSNQGGRELPPSGVINVPPPDNNTVSTPLPRARNGRVVVMVDPGHGGKDPGAIGYRGVREKDVIMPIAEQVAQLLEQQGVQAIMTRNSDYFVDLQPRVTMAERAGADLFVSIHANAIGGRPDVQGIETYYYSNGARLARTIHNSILQTTGARDRGVRQARFYVLRKSSMPSVLVETGFVTNAEEASRLADPAYQRQMAQAIARGILQYIQQNL